MGKNCKTLDFLGGCNFRKGKYLTNCRASNSQCGGQGFDPPLLHHQLTFATDLMRHELLISPIYTRIIASATNRIFLSDSNPSLFACASTQRNFAAAAALVMFPVGIAPASRALTPGSYAVVVVEFAGN